MRGIQFRSSINNTCSTQKHSWNKWNNFEEKKVIEKTCLTTDCQTTKINPENNAVIVFDRKIYL